MSNLRLSFYLASALLALASGQRAEYGQDCIPGEIPCISSDILDPIRCSSDSKAGVCICDAHMFRITTPTYSRCVSSHNMTCTLSSNDGLPVRTCTEYAQCWPSIPSPAQVSRQNGTCFCDRDAKHDQFTDQCKLTFGSDRCTLDTDCDIMSLLKCEEGTCVCEDAEFQTFVPETGMCMALVGGSCMGRPPYPGAYCAAHNMGCNVSTGVCQCIATYMTNPDKTCGKEFGQACDPASSPLDCHAYFECDATDRRCLCRAGTEHYNGVCRILAGGSCPRTDIDMSCTAHATCKDGTCACAGNFKAGPQGTCLGLLGAICDSQTSPCSSADFLECGAGNVCTCKASYEADAATNTCKGLIGQECRAGGTDCIGNSVCGTTDGLNLCECPTRHEPSADLKTCEALHGTACGPGVAECSATRFLACNGDAEAPTCACADPTKQIYETARDQCLAKANMECLGSAAGIPCVAQATCLDATPRVCFCNPGYEAAADGTCADPTPPPTEPTTPVPPPPTDPPAPMGRE